MCTYNGARYLGEQLDSIAAQSRPPDELVICDDCSDDSTDRIVCHFADGSPFPVRFQRNEKRLGSTKNFELAIGYCEGEIIVLADQDDVWHRDKLRLIEAEFEKRPEVGCVFSDAEVVDENLRPLGWRVWQLIRFGEKEQILFDQDLAFDVLLDHNVVTGATMAFRAEFRDLILPIPIDLVHDGITVLHDGWAALMLSAVTELVFVSSLLIKYRQHPEQQLGVGSALGVGAQLQATGGATAISAAMRRRNSFTGEIRYLDTIRQRLSLKAATITRGNVLSSLDARLAHVVARAGMPSNKLSRVPTVLRELLRLHYHRYSNGISSAVKDLFLAPRNDEKADLPLSRQLRGGEKEESPRVVNASHNNYSDL
jgi:glycosyltransferase involved in cell wall biosynthesis